MNQSMNPIFDQTMNMTQMFNQNMNPMMNNQNMNLMMNNQNMNPMMIQNMNKMMNQNMNPMMNNQNMNQMMNQNMNPMMNNQNMNQMMNNQNMNPMMNNQNMNQMMNQNMNQMMNNQNMNQMMNQNMNQMMNQNMNQMMNNQNMNEMKENAVLSRLVKEYKLCTQDNDLIQIGCNFGIEKNNYYSWRVTMIGPKNTPYENGLFTILINFPQDYPLHGPEFKFKNKIYHLNVDFENDLGHICLSSINSWRTSGKVRDKPVYTVKQALFDIFCLFYNQGIEAAYSQNMALEYQNNREKFNEKAKQWTKDFASGKN